MPALLKDSDRLPLSSERRLLAPRRGWHAPPRPDRSLPAPGRGVLSYDSDRRLSEGMRVLADYAPGSGRCYGHVTAAAGSYEIVRRHSAGWGFCLDETETDACVCAYAPFPIGRGGRLTGVAGEAILRGVPLRPHRWTYEAGGWAAGIRVVRRYPTRELCVEAAQPLPVSAHAAAVLAFGCWLIVEWESISLPGGGG